MSFMAEWGFEPQVVSPMPSSRIVCLSVCIRMLGNRVEQEVRAEQSDLLMGKGLEWTGVNC